LKNLNNLKFAWHDQLLWLVSPLTKKLTKLAGLSLRQADAIEIIHSSI
jgi:hypothetical protein